MGTMQVQGGANRGTEKREGQILLKRKPIQRVYMLVPGEFSSMKEMSRRMDHMATMGRWGHNFWFQPNQGTEIVAITLASGFRIVEHYPRQREGDIREGR